MEFGATQLAQARAQAWHQDGAALLTLEAARAWVEAHGLVLFAPRAAQLGTPAPSLVEATLGAANASPSATEMETARSLVARMVEEGSAVGLNLLGTDAAASGDGVPDFVVSAQVFSYVFTMRGDKAWKRAPETAGAGGVSPLGLRVYEVLGERGGLSATELAAELGREVSETAVLRALAELWSQLRVLPRLALATGGRTVWEPATARFTKAIKAGANAGQPTAMSALVGLYLGQAVAATEEEIATFLSPLTARSRAREVLHALLGARQLETVAVEGRTLLHVAGSLLQVAESLPAVAGEGEAAAPAKPKKVGTGFPARAASVAAAEDAEGDGRIRRFTSERKTAGEFRGKPAFGKTKPAFAKAGGFAKKPGAFAKGKPAFGKAKEGFRAKPNSGPRVNGAERPRAEGRTEPERRPFRRDAGRDAATKPATFTRPWAESPGGARPVQRVKRDAEATPAAGAPSSPALPEAFRKYQRPAAGARAPLGPREQAGLPVERRSAPKKASTSFDRGRPGGFTAKSKFGDKAKFGDKPKFAAKAKFGDKPSFGAKSSFGAKPKFAAKGKFGDKPSFGAKPSFGDKPKFGAKPRFGGAKPKFENKPGASKPAFERAPGPADAGASESVERTLPKRPYKPRAADAHTRTFTKAPWTPAEDGAAERPRAGKTFAGAKRFGAAKKSFGGPKKFGAGKKFGARPAGAKPFAAKPFSTRPGARKRPGAEE